MSGCPIRSSNITQLPVVHQYYYADQGPTYTGPGDFAPYPALSGDCDRQVGASIAITPITTATMAAAPCASYGYAVHHGYSHHIVRYRLARGSASHRMAMQHDASPHY